VLGFEFRVLYLLTSYLHLLFDEYVESVNVFFENLFILSNIYVIKQIGNETEWLSNTSCQLKCNFFQKHSWLHTLNSTIKVLEIDKKIG